MIRKNVEKWGIDELMRFLFVCMVSSPGKKITMRKDVMKAVPPDFLHLMGVEDVGHSYMLHFKDNKRLKDVLVPRGGIWTPSGDG